MTDADDLDDTWLELEILPFVDVAAAWGGIDYTVAIEECCSSLQFWGNADVRILPFGIMSFGPFPWKSPFSASQG